MIKVKLFAKTLILLLLLNSCEGEDYTSDKETVSQENAQIVRIVPDTGSSSVPCSAKIVITADTALSLTKTGTVQIDTVLFEDKINCDIVIQDKTITVSPHTAFSPECTFTGISVKGFVTNNDVQITSYRDDAYSFTTDAQVTNPEGYLKDLPRAIRINEICVGNTGGAGNEFIELYNSGDTSINLDGTTTDKDFAIYKFTNGAVSRNSWQLLCTFNGSTLTIEPNGYLCAAAGSYEQAGFLSYQGALSKNSGGIALVQGSRSEGKIIDIVCYNVDGSWNNTHFCQWSIDGASSENGSFIRHPDGVDSDTVSDWSVSPSPTPGLSNISGISFTSKPVLLPLHLTQPGAITLQTQTNSDAALYYIAVARSELPTGSQILQAKSSYNVAAQYNGNFALEKNTTGSTLIENIMAGKYTVYALAYAATTGMSTTVVKAGEFTVLPESGSLFSCCYSFEGESAAASETSGIEAASIIFKSGTPAFPAGCNSTDSISTSLWRDQDANYIEITLNASGKTITLNNIFFNNLASASGPSTYSITTSQDSHTAPLAAGNTSTSTNAAFGSAVISMPVTDENLLTIRIHGFGATSSSGTWRIDNLTFDGVVK